MELFEFILRKDLDIRILEEAEFNANSLPAPVTNASPLKMNTSASNGDLLRETMVETITKYEKMINSCKTEEEKTILKNMIMTIKKQLLNLPKTTESTEGNSILPIEFRNNNDTSIMMKKKKNVDKWKFFDNCLREIFFFLLRNKAML